MPFLAERLSKPFAGTNIDLIVGYRRLNVAFVHLARNARIFAYFKLNAGLQLLQGLVQILIFLFLGKLMGFAPSYQLVGGNYASYLIIGMVVLQYLDKTLIAPYVSLSSAYWSARLESLLLSPYSLWLFIITDTFWYYVMTTINASAILVVGLFFGAVLNAPSSWSMALAVLFAGALAVLGLGLISASTFSLLNAKGNDEPVSWGVHLLQGLVTGLYFPVRLLPHALQYVGLFLPHTYAIDSMRRLFLRHHTAGASLIVHQWFELDPLLINLICIILGVMSYLPLGIYLFERGIKRSRETGSLSRWT